MKYLLLLLVILASQLCAGQKIHFTDRSNTWIYQYTVSAWNPTQGHHDETNRVQYGYTDSSVRYGKLFYKLSYHYIYEDTVRGIVYIDDSSQILYDYNRQVGDTFSRPFGMNTVTKIDTITVGGYPYKVFSINTDDPVIVSHTYKIIEGVGSTLTMFFPFDNASSMEHDQSLVCFTNNNFRPQIDAPYSINIAKNHCESPFLEVSAIAQNNLVRIFPQPGKEYVNIQLPSAFHSGTLQIYDLSVSTPKNRTV